MLSVAYTAWNLVLSWRNLSGVCSAGFSVRTNIRRPLAATSPTDVCCRLGSFHGAHRNGNIRTVTAGRAQRLSGDEVLCLLSNWLVQAKRCFILIVCYSSVVRLHVKDAKNYLPDNSHELRRNDNINGKMLGDNAGHEFRLSDDW
jgi:hypothetical protein